HSCLRRCPTGWQFPGWGGTDFRPPGAKGDNGPRDDEGIGTFPVPRLNSPRVAGYKDARRLCESSYPRGQKCRKPFSEENGFQGCAFPAGDRGQGNEVPGDWATPGRLLGDRAKAMGEPPFLCSPWPALFPGRWECPSEVPNGTTKTIPGRIA